MFKLISGISKNYPASKPVVVLDLKPDDRLYQGIYEEAIKYGYGILDLLSTSGNIPTGMNVAGILTMDAPKRVMERQSTNHLEITDPVVNNAINFIRENFRKQLSIDDIAKAVGVARSTLILKFKKHYNKGCQCRTSTTTLRAFKNTPN